MPMWQGPIPWGSLHPHPHFNKNPYANKQSPKLTQLLTLHQLPHSCSWHLLNKFQQCAFFGVWIFFIRSKSYQWIALSVSRSVTHWPCWILLKLLNLSKFLEVVKRIYLGCYMNLSKPLQGFVKVFTGICQSYSIFFSPFGKQNPAEMWPRLKVCGSFCSEIKLLNESKYSMPWVRCAFNNVLYGNVMYLSNTVFVNWTNISTNFETAVLSNVMPIIFPNPKCMMKVLDTLKKYHRRWR